MAEVIFFDQPALKIWVCGCGCASFDLMSDGSAKCSLCGEWDTEEGGWFRDVVDRPDVGDDVNPVKDIHGNGSVDFARRRAQKVASDPDARLVVSACQEGAVTVWSNVESEDQRSWAIERLQQAIALIKDFRLG
jgi:hypothetical protein